MLIMHRSPPYGVVNDMKQMVNILYSNFFHNICV